MNIKNKTILVTGGGSGIGFEIASQLAAKKNKVIIVGRTESKLKAAAEKIGNINYFVGDINSNEDSLSLKNFLVDTFGGLDVLINNAGTAAPHILGEGGSAEKAAYEFQTNFFSAIRLIDELLPLLSKAEEGIIVNVTSIVALVPNGKLPTYSASKAALHSYTELLRLSLSKTSSVKVFELMPPLVNTEFSAPIGGANGMPPAEVADSLINGIENNVYEIHTGMTANIYQLSRAATYQNAFNAVNQS